MNPPPQTPTTGLSFASAAKRNKPKERAVPTDEQAVVIETVEGIPPEDYLLALIEYTDPQNITYVSKLSKNRICIYLKDKKTAEELTKNHQTIKIQQENIIIRPLLTPARRLIISYARPSVPDNFIKNLLIQNGLEPTSDMHFLRAGIKDPRLAHVLGFKRCIYIKSIENQNIPEAITFEYGGSNHTIVITEDINICNHCKKPGHSTEACRFKINSNAHNLSQIATTTNPTTQQIQQHEETNEINVQQTCPNKSANNENNNQPAQNPLQTIINPQDSEELHEVHQSQNINTNSQKKTRTTNEQQQKPHEQEEDKPTNTQMATKRTGPSISSVGSEESLTEETRTKNQTYSEPKKIPSKTKRTRSYSPCSPTEDWLRPAEELLDSFILSYDQTYSLIESLNNNTDPISTIREYTDEIDLVIEKMKEIYNQTKNRSAKYRITKILNNIELQQNKTSSEEEEECMET